jgi:hypothetical protein
MKTRMFMTTIVTLATLLFATNSQAQFGRGPRGNGGWGADAEYGRKYDPKTVETLTGEVVKVNRFRPGRGVSSGIHLQLKTDNETIPVHLGPAWFIENQDGEIEANDTITVKGSRITFDEKPAIIAAEIVKGEQVLKLRDEKGFPMWAGWRRR